MPAPRPSWSSTVLGVVVAATIMAAATPLTADAVAPARPTGAATGVGAAAATPAARPAVHRVVVAGGVRQYVDCRGPSGVGPTVVLISGLGAGSAYWARVRDALGTRARVCGYDRPGLGRSPTRPKVRTVDAGVHAAELAAALTAVGERGPLVVVGHSYGGLVARAFAIRYPTRIAALLLLDACYAGQWRGGGGFWPEPRARIDMRSTERLVWGRPLLRGKPLVVMTAAFGSSAHWLERQRAMATLSSNVQHVVVASSHVIQQYRPAAVVAGVRALLLAAHGRALLPCRRVAAAWARVGAHCSA